MKNLIFRVVTSLILLPLVISSFLTGGYYFIFLLIIVSLLSAYEVSGMIMPKSHLGLAVTTLSWAGIFSAIIVGDNFLHSFALIICALFLANISFLFIPEITKQAYEKLCAIFYVNFYVLCGIGSLFWLRQGLAESTGIAFIFLACLATWANDSCAYFGGRLWGEHKLFESVSAKKTWEGFFSGAIGSLALIFILDASLRAYGFEVFSALSTKDLLWVGLPTMILGPLGDLIESRLKRIYDLKDSSNILPGHGGLLDRIDGLLLVLPWTALYAFLIRPL